MNKKILFVFVFILGIFMFSFASAALVDDIYLYFKFDGTATTIDSVAGFNTSTTASNTSGKIGNAYLYDSDTTGTAGYKPYTTSINAGSVNFWIKTTDSDRYSIFQQDGSGVTNNVDTQIGFEGTAGVGGTAPFCGTGIFCMSINRVITVQTPIGNINNGSWHMITVTVDGTTHRLYFDGINVDNATTTDNIFGGQNGDSGFFMGIATFNGTLDEYGIWNKSLSQEEVTILYNSGDGLTYPFALEGIEVDLISPQNDSKQSGNVSFESDLDFVEINATNATLNIWFENGTLFKSEFQDVSANNTNITINFNDINGFSSNKFLWNVIAFGTNGTNIFNAIADNNFTFEWRPFTENSITFSSNSFETDSQQFILNITTLQNILSVSAFLNYDGETYSSTVICTSGVCIISNEIDIPLVISGENENKSFLWEIIVFDGQDSFSFNSSTNNQNVTRIHLEECDGTFTIQTLNFTTYDEQNLTRINPYMFDATFDQWLGNGNVKRQTNFSQSSIAEQSLCILPINEIYNIDAIIEYDEAGTGTIYTERNYFFQNDLINNVSQDIFLYLLQSSASTSFILKVQDDSLLPISNALVEINRFYPGTNEFRIVQIARTDDLGKSVGFFETETVDYKFLITQNNEVLLETGLQKVIPESSPFTLTFNVGEPLGVPWSSQNEIEALNSSLTWDETSGIMTYVYQDTSGNFTLARLLVVKQSLTNSSANEVICNVNSSLASATLTCNVGSTAGFYVASSFITRDSTAQLDAQIGFQIETLSGVVGLLGLFFGWFLILIASFMFKFNEIVGIWAVTVTIFLINLTGLINFGGVFVTAVVALAILITWIMER